VSDSNETLIATYIAVRDHPREIADALAAMPNTPEYYYNVRSRYRNTNRDDAIALATDFLYLNHHSFNGIHRVNKAGQYNVPFGHRKSVQIPDETHLLRAAKRLATATLKAEGYESALERVKPGDFVYVDPPYTVAHNNNGFVKYNQQLFTFDDQVTLSKKIVHLARAGAHVVVSNADHKSIHDLYSDLRQYAVPRKSTVGGRNASRLHTTELLVTNFDLEAFRAYRR
jgi:DNA adenine methylase